ncbi:helix-turn-helix domain-containing protein [Ectobacillus ponti]|uniref:Helix-turn-helix domain-containing protein n=1 Tax=Ectobacillus ponti TaxID=2961894 RepID=A0AA41XBK0_9BACI|nr:helix-turn-helix domain-containing protein [Ectobacillus ponti]MCP8969863.1 helix-turn-helix domain-containing protein [Ectobacillus ponti]
MKAKADLILHPVRMQIVQTLVGGRKLTVQEMLQRLPDVAQATLYRHLNKLVEGSVVEVAAQHQVRGTVEKVYALSQSGAHVSGEEFLRSSKEEQMGVFMQFMSNLMNSFGGYLEQEDRDFIRDGVSFRQADLYMSDEEFLEFAKELGAAFQKVMAHEPAEHRRKRTIATIMIPEVKKGEAKQ